MPEGLPGARHPESALRDRLLEAVALKDLPRAGWVRIGVPAPESVAAHSWGVAWLVLVLCPEHLDRGRALAMAVVHDVAEVRAGDVTPHDGVPAERKHRAEHEALRGLCEGLPGGAEIIELWRELEHGTSAEGRFVRACDKLDMALTAQHYERRSAVDARELIESALASLSDPDLRELAAPPRA